MVVGSLTLVILAEITHLVGALAGGLIYGEWPSSYSMLRSMIGLSGFSIGVTWFLVALAFVRLLVYIVITGGAFARWIVLFLALSSLFVSQASGFRMFQLQAWWSGLFFYFVGYVSAPLIRDRLFSIDLRSGPAVMRHIVVLSLATVAAAIVTHFVALWNLGCPLNPFATCGSEQLYGHFIVRMIAGNYGFVPLFLLSSISGMVFFMLLSILMTALPERFVRWLCWVGRNSLSLLLLNGFFLYLGNRIIKDSFAAGYPEWMPWVLPFAVLAGHLLVLPFVVPMIRYAERLSKQIATALVDWAVSGTRALR